MTPESRQPSVRGLVRHTLGRVPDAVSRRHGSSWPTAGGPGEVPARPARLQNGAMPAPWGVSRGAWQSGWGPAPTASFSSGCFPPRSQGQGGRGGSSHREPEVGSPPGGSEGARGPAAELLPDAVSGLAWAGGQQGRRRGQHHTAHRPPRARGVYQPLRHFFHDILHTKYRAATDVYALMFLADVVDFIIIIFGFWAFGVSRSAGSPVSRHPAATGHPDLCSPDHRSTRRPRTSRPPCQTTRCPRPSWSCC